MRRILTLGVIGACVWAVSASEAAACTCFSGGITTFAQDDRDRYWLGTREGVSRLSVEGTEWRIEPMGLEGPVSALAFEPRGYLIAAVDGRGVFRARVP